MEIRGTRTLKTRIDRLWDALDNPDLLARCAPGCKELELVGDGEYRALLELGVAAIKGRYVSRVTITDRERTDGSGSLRVAISGDGDSGFLHGTGQVQLEDRGTGTYVAYHANVTVGGKVAGIGQRVLGGIANMLINQFFKSLEKELQRAEVS